MAPLTDLEIAEVDNLVLETERLEMAENTIDENMIDIDNDDLLGDSPDLDAEKIEAISQLSPANAVYKESAAIGQHLALAKATATSQEPAQKNLSDAYVPKGLLKKKAPRSPDIKGANASKKLQALNTRASPKKKALTGPRMKPAHGPSSAWFGEQFRASGSSHDSVPHIFPLQLLSPHAAPHAAAPQDPGVMPVHLLVQQPGREHLPFLQPNPRRGHSTWFTKSKNGISRASTVMYSMLRFGYPKWSVIPTDERELWFHNSRKSSTGTPIIRKQSVAHTNKTTGQIQDPVIKGVVDLVEAEIVSQSQPLSDDGESTGALTNMSLLQINEMVEKVVLKMLPEMGTVENIPKFIEGVREQGCEAIPEEEEPERSSMAVKIRHEPFFLSISLSPSASCPCTDTPIPHLHGKLKYGDNLEDEWFAVFLLFRISAAFPSTSIRAWDTDGEFLLIEAAFHLPRWLNPETSRNRVFVRGGDLHVVPRSRLPDPSLLASCGFSSSAG
ncbi:hypothetical protein Bca52824_040248 [Brassica carinata]|uniref:Uncharacterized protein n=1 Tax=Brassica carinata TaxID=52824 RepID=A0A8X7UWR5_BRACI|nr:hypothetical protein Bca52824_040248 [Brassica carinata]